MCYCKCVFKYNNVYAHTCVCIFVRFYVCVCVYMCVCACSSSSSKYIRTKAAKVNIHTNGQKRVDPMGQVLICSLVPIR